MGTRGKYHKPETDPLAVLKDQTTPQTITGGIPKLEEDRDITENHQLVDKLFVDNAVASLGSFFYMLSTGSGINEPTEAEEYYNTSLTASGEVESSVTATNPADDEYIAGWISPSDVLLSKLVAGIYNWEIITESTGAGNKVYKLYGTLTERKSNGDEVLIATSCLSDIVNSKKRNRFPITLASDHEMSLGSRFVGKIYASLVSGASASNIVIYSEGDCNSHWELPVNKDILDTTYATKGKIESINEQTGTTYIPALTDIGGLVRCTNASDVIVTIPNDSYIDFDVRSVITFEQGGAGSVLIKGADGVTIQALDDGRMTADQYAGIQVTKIADNVWWAIGGTVSDVDTTTTTTSEATTTTTTV